MTDLEILRDYIRRETGYDGDLDPDLDLLEKQVLDSFSIVQWAMFIQERFRSSLKRRSCCAIISPVFRR